MNGTLAGKIAVVTGAAGGIGQAILRRFHADGATVVAVDREADALSAAVHGLSRVRTCAVDISLSRGVDEVVSMVGTALGRIDILVNNAGVGGPRTKRLHELELEEFDAVMAVNIRAALALTRAVLPGMVAQRSGSIVNIASPAGFHAVPRVGPYCISKAALVMLTKQTAKEYASDGIRANAVAPGVTQTPILDDLPQADLDRITAMIPQGRMARADEIAAMVAVLASDQASYVNGAIVFVDGAAGT